jgi:hypothetical protein
MEYKIHRRAMLGMLVAGAAATMGFTPSPKNPGTQELNFIQEPATSKLPVSTQNGQFEKDRLSWLFKYYSAERGLSQEEKIRAIEQGLSVVQNNFGNGSCLMLDECGYFLTAAHLFRLSNNNSNGLTGNLKLDVYNPASGIRAEIKSYLLDLSYDVAVFFAPTGKAPKAVDGLSIRQGFEDGEALTGMGLVPLRTNRINIQRGGVLQEARVTGLSNSADNSRTTMRTNLAVLGMLAFPGCSGGPAHSQGDVVGVVSTMYGDWREYFSSERPNDRFHPFFRRYQEGTGIAPLPPINSLIENPLRP